MSRKTSEVALAAVKQRDNRGDERLGGMLGLGRM